MRVGTYNVHGFVGRDGRRDVPRVAEVINQLGCHAVGLQEVDSRGAATTLAELEALTGMSAMPGSTIFTSDGDYGNVILTRLDVLEINRHDLTSGGREPRGAIEARFDLGNGSTLTMLVTHLGLHRRERWRQTRSLLRICSRCDRDPILALAGDFNEWWPRARSLDALHRAFGRSRALRSFPSFKPIFALDRIWVRPCTAVRDLRVIDTPSTRLASDHLPVVADLHEPFWPPPVI
jgi:endonuclease/exonuclease/phosphatase family metal-dependent hydrolase